MAPTRLEVLLPLTSSLSLCTSSSSLAHTVQAMTRAPVSQVSRLLRPTPPADSQPVVIVALCRRPDLAISSLLPRPLLLPPIDYVIRLNPALFSSIPLLLLLPFPLSSCLISPALGVSNPHPDLLLLIGFRCLWRWREKVGRAGGKISRRRLP